MAVGFPPKHVKDHHLGGMDKDVFLVLASHSAQSMGWKLLFINESGFIARTPFSLWSWGEKVKVCIDGEVARISSQCIGSQLFDWGKNKDNIENLLTAAADAEHDLGSDTTYLNYNVLRQNFNQIKNALLLQPVDSNKKRFLNFLSIFKPIKGYYILPILININIIVYIAMLFSGVHALLPNTQDLIRWGANFHPLVEMGQWWRVFTSMFLHVGAIHLILNMYALLFIGSIVEPLLGKTRFLASYLLTGVFASLTSLWWNDFSVSAGASGAIFGLYGLTLALLSTRLLTKASDKSLIISIAVFVVYNILFGLKNISGIDNAAHIGGLISGVITGYAMIPSMRDKDNVTLKFGSVGILTIALCLIAWAASTKLNSDIEAYSREMDRFVYMESMALEVFNLPEGTPSETILSELKDRGIYYWQENIKLLDSFDELDLPLAIKERNRKLHSYCELRIKSYKLMYKAIEEDTDIYRFRIQECDNQLIKIMAELGVERH